MITSRRLLFSLALVVAAVAGLGSSHATNERDSPRLDHHHNRPQSVGGGRKNQQTSDNGAGEENHIFNAVHGALKAWDSAVNLNGMSVFLATIPEGVTVFHGRSDNQTVEGMEWLAYEPEHAINFATTALRSPADPEHPHRPPPVSFSSLSFPDDSPNDGLSSLKAKEASEKSRAQQLPLQSPRNQDIKASGENAIPGQKPFMAAKGTKQEGGNRDDLEYVHRRSSEQDHLAGDIDPNTLPPLRGPGWLQTFRAKRNLRVLYIDGQAAGKNEGGCLDSQDCLILNKSCDPSKCTPYGEGVRAPSLCDLADGQWKGRIDGFLRMELGFELILCHFNQTLDLVGQVLTEGDNTHTPLEPLDPLPSAAAAWYTVAVSRFDGLGIFRAKLHVDSMVTVYGSGIDLFKNGTDLPRLDLPDPEIHAGLRDKIDEVALNFDEDRKEQQQKFSWQAIAEAIVQRFSKDLEYLASDDDRLSSTTMMAGYVMERFYRPFIDFPQRNATAEVERCANQFLPSGVYDESVASHAVTSIAHRICGDLHHVLVLREDEDKIDGASSADDAKATLKGLVEYLQWPIWKKCKGCAANEVCSIPMFPVGSVEDSRKPICRTAQEAVDQRGFWRQGRCKGPILA